MKNFYSFPKTILLVFVLALSIDSFASQHHSSIKETSKHVLRVSDSKKYGTKKPVLLKVATFDTSEEETGFPHLVANKALIMDHDSGEILYAKNIDEPSPIASVTKLMVAMVVLDAHLSLDEVLEITYEDVDFLKNSSSKLPVGTHLTRGELLHMAIMASENRAASALGRNYPGGIHSFVSAMNNKAMSLGMINTFFSDSTGLSERNISTASDLARMVKAAYQYPTIRQVSTWAEQIFDIGDAHHLVHFRNTNSLVRKHNEAWEIGLSKTGYISEAGKCLVMQAKIAGRSIILVFLDSLSNASRLRDAERVRRWLGGEFHTTRTSSIHSYNHKKRLVRRG